jgi:hypothetical protein
VGVILYELLTGERHRPDSRPPSLVCGCDTALDRICQRATNPNPSLRYADGHAFAADLASWLKQHQPRAATAARSGHQPPMRAPAARQAPPVIKRSNSGALAGRLLFLALLVVGGYFAWQHRDRLAATFSTGKKVPATPAATEELAPPPPLEKSVPATEVFEEKPSATQPEQPKIEDTLTPKARKLIADSEAERTKQLGDNLRWLADNLSRWARNAPSNERSAREGQITRLRSIVQNSRVPSGSAATFSAEMQRLVSQAVERQSVIDAAYTTKVSRYRDLYVGKMREKLRLAQESGQGAVASELERRLETAGDLDTWIRGMGGSVPAPDSATKQGALDSIFGSPEP